MSSTNSNPVFTLLSNDTALVMSHDLDVPESNVSSQSPFTPLPISSIWRCSVLDTVSHLVSKTSCSSDFLLPSLDFLSVFYWSFIISSTSEHQAQSLDFLSFYTHSLGDLIQFQDWWVRKWNCPAQASLLNFRLIYPTIFMTSPVGCLTAHTLHFYSRSLDAFLPFSSDLFLLQSIPSHLMTMSSF